MRALEKAGARKLLEGEKVSVWLSGQIGDVDFIRVVEGDCIGPSGELYPYKAGGVPHMNRTKLQPDWWVRVPEAEGRFLRVLMGREDSAHGETVR